MGPSGNCRSPTRGFPDFFSHPPIGPRGSSCYGSFVPFEHHNHHTKIPVCHRHGISKTCRGGSAHYPSPLDLEQLLLTALRHHLPLSRTRPKATTLTRLDSLKTNNPLIELVLPVFVPRIHLLRGICFQCSRFPPTLSNQADNPKYNPHPT